jgi:hypothetical protein
VAVGSAPMDESEAAMWGIRSQGALRLFSLHNAEYMIWKMTHMQICRYPDRIEIYIEALEARRREEKSH